MKVNSARATVIFFLLFVTALLNSCVSRGVAKAEEYYSIGMAYFDIGKYSEAEIWLNKARIADKTMTASEYNLGRIAFETGRYEDAAKHFERILVRDPENIMALKGAAYSRIKNGDLQKAEALYNRVIAMVPENSDDGYNYALVLFGLKKYEDCERVLKNYPIALDDDDNSILLLARAQKAQDKIEAADSYAKWVTMNKSQNPQALYEYARVLETAGFYALALEQYKAAISALDSDTASLKKPDIRFELASLLLTADPGNSEGIQELNDAITEGFSDKKAIEALLLDERVTGEQKSSIRQILDDMPI